MGLKVSELLMGCDTSEAAAYGLAALMSAISEECWAAGWLTGLEHSCWKAAAAQSEMKFGMGAITKRQAVLLKMLSDEADGWWAWPADERDGPVFLRLSEWTVRARPLPQQERREG